MAVITVTSKANWGKGSLRDAIAKAQSGDTIKFDAGLSNQTITLEKFIGISKSLTIDGGDAPGLKISGGNQTNIFWFGKANENLTIRNLTLADSYFEATAGGAVWANNNSTVNIDNVNFFNNISDGAALHGQAGSVITVSNSTFDGNDGAKISDKTYSAGAISLFAYGSLTVSNSVFTNNKGYSGGAIKVTSSDLIVEDSVFVGNDSTAGADKEFVDVPGAGGAIYLDAASVPNDPRFYGNLPGHTNQGEAEGGVFKVNNSLFENNRAAGAGGAIMAWGYSQDRVIISNSEIVNNEVIRNTSGAARGGGLWLMGFVEIDNTTISDNKSADSGGGLYLWGEVPAKIVDSEFSGNQAVTGGAIYDNLWNSRTDISNTNFVANAAVNEAGVFYSQNHRPVSFQNSQFSNNTPDDLTNVSFDSNVPDIAYGSNSNDTIIGTDQNSYLMGLNGNDTLEGNGGNDYLHGGANNDYLWGGAGNDTLVGGGEWNNLFGGDGNDIFIGGNGQDLMEGGSGRDRYIIGDEDNIFYTNHTWYDHAIIKDFNTEQDIIQLKGQATDYTIKAANSQGYYGSGIFYNNGMVALVANIASKDLSLNADYISYGSNSNFSQSDASAVENLQSDVTSVESKGLKLSQDSLIVGTPNYNANEHDGLIIWNQDDTWHLEASGNASGSYFKGRIVADRQIENLNAYKMEDSDSVEFADNSQQIIEFDLTVWEKWIDGLSFQVADGASVFLELDSNPDISIKVGENLQEIGSF